MRDWIIDILFVIVFASGWLMAGYLLCLNIGGAK